MTDTPAWNIEPHGDRDTTTRALLDGALTFDPITRHGLSDHLPMALGALDGLGAPAKRLSDFFNFYAQMLVPVREEVAATRARYERGFERDGVDATLRAHLPRLLPGIGSAAFHGVIRLAYAIEANHVGQLAAALAYWDEVFEPLSDEIPREEDADPTALLRTLRGSPSLRVQTFEGSNISSKMAEAATLREFANAGGIAVADDTLGRLAAAARALYAATGDFVALHAITGTHATRVVSTFLDVDDRSRAVRYLYQAVAAAYVIIGTPPIEVASFEHAPSWDTIAIAARASNDEHVIKIAYSAREEAATWGDDEVYRACAARAASLL